MPPHAVCPWHPCGHWESPPACAVCPAPAALQPGVPPPAGNMWQDRTPGTVLPPLSPPAALPQIPSVCPVPTAPFPLYRACLALIWVARVFLPLPPQSFPILVPGAARGTGRGTPALSLCCHCVAWGSGWQQVPGGPKNTGLGGPSALLFPDSPGWGVGWKPRGCGVVTGVVQEHLQAWPRNG